MRRSLICLVAAFACCAVCQVANADYSVIDKGTWPATWPAELEPLRTQARTLEGPMVLNQHFAIRFTSREQFEAAWPHLLKVKGKGASVVLVRGPNFFLGDQAKAGVVVHAPPRGEPDAPVAKGRGGGRSLYTTYIELLVDGEIVDLNRIPLPPDTPIIDDRFKETKR